MHFRALLLSLLNSFIFLVLVLVSLDLRVMMINTMLMMMMMMMVINLSLLSLTLLLNGVKSAWLFSVLLTLMMVPVFVVLVLFLLVFWWRRLFINISTFFRNLTLLFHYKFIQTSRFLLLSHNAARSGVTTSFGLPFVLN